MSDDTLASPPKEAHDDPLIGRTLDDRYRVLGALGEGGMGKVYRAIQLKLDRMVAVKVLHPAYSAQADLRVRFEREAVALAQINHEHILHAYDHGVTEDGRLYLVTELLQGEPLNRLIASHSDRRLPLMPAVIILRQLASALEALHGSLVHRDLKPHNVFVLSEPGGLRTKLLDFGIVRPAGGSDLTRPGLIGTPAYMSPEQAQQDSSVDARSDLYSLGVMAFELLTGRPPFWDKPDIKILLDHIEAPPPRVDSVISNAEMPAALVDLVDQLLSKERDLRPQSAQEVRTRLMAIEALLSGPPTLAEVDGPLAEALRETPIPLTPASLGTTPLDSRPSAPLTEPRTTFSWAALAGGASLVLALAIAGLSSMRPWSLGLEPAQPPQRPAGQREEARPVQPIPTESTARLPSSGPEQPVEPPLTPPPAPAPTIGGTSAAAGIGPTKSSRQAPRASHRQPLERPDALEPTASSHAPETRESRPLVPPPAAPTGRVEVSARTLTGTQPLIEVLLEDKLLGQGARVTLELPPGEHVLTVRRAGTQVGRTRTVRVAAGQTAQAKVLLD